MPVHLPPFSRRRFIAGSLAAGAGWALGAGLFAAEEKPVEENLWVLLSDTHIAADKSIVHLGANMTDNLRAVCGEVTALPRRPAGVIISGDCAYNQGETGDYTAITGLLQPLRAAQMPVRITVGNHDDRGHFWRSLAGADEPQRPVPDHQTALIKTPRANWFILDTLEKTLSTPGLLGPEQLQWLAGALDANADRPALVVAHHHLTTLGEPSIALKDSEEFLAVIRPRKQVKAYFYGHTHNWNLQRDPSGIHMINLPPTAYLFSPGPPNGWVRAALEPNGVRLELSCLDRKHKEHGKVVELEYRA